MTRFRYKSTTVGGDVVEGEMEAADADAVIERLRAQGQILIRADRLDGNEVKKRRSSPRWFARRRITGDEVTEFTLALSTLLQAGLSVDKALAIIGRLGSEGPVTRLVEGLHIDVRQGASLSAAMQSRPHAFSRFYVNLVQAGETGGALESALSRLADFLERSREVRDTVVSALIYPVILLALAAVSIVVILSYVTPRFAELFADAGVALPWPTLVVMSIGTFFGDYGWTVPFVLVAGVMLFRQLCAHANSRRRWDRLIVSLPFIGALTARYETARFSRTLGTLLNSGVPVLDAITVALGAVGNSAMVLALGRVTNSVRDGRGMADALSEDANVPRLAVELVSVGEETATLGEMLLKLATIYERDVRTSVQRMVSVFEPALIVVLALMVAAIMFSVLSAVLRINDIVI